jgi:hypothetical protein
MTSLTQIILTSLTGGKIQCRQRIGLQMAVDVYFLLTGQSENPAKVLPESLKLSDCATFYGYVIDRNSRKNVSMCSERLYSETDKPRESTPRAIYVSRSNQLQIVTERDVNHKFVVRVEGEMRTQSLFMLG